MSAYPSAPSSSEEYIGWEVCIHLCPSHLSLRARTTPLSPTSSNFKNFKSNLHLTPPQPPHHNDTAHFFVLLLILTRLSLSPSPSPSHSPSPSPSPPLSLSLSLACCRGLAVKAEPPKERQRAPGVWLVEACRLALPRAGRRQGAVRGQVCDIKDTPLLMHTHTRAIRNAPPLLLPSPAPPPNHLVTFE